MKVLNLDCTPGTDYCTISTTLNKNKVGEVKRIEVPNDKYNVDSYFEKADAFKYTFKLENNNYYFVSSELVK